MHWKVPLLRVPEAAVVDVHDWDCVTKSGKTNPWKLKVQLAELTPAGESATPIVQATVFEPPPVLTEVGANTKLVSDGGVRSSGLEVTASVVAGRNGPPGKFPTRSVAKTLGVHVPASA